MQSAPRPRLLALLVFHNEMRYLPGWFENVRPHVDGVGARPAPPVPDRLALLFFHSEMRSLPGWFENVLPHVDGVVALDDGSTDGSGDFVAAQPGVLEVVRVPPRAPHAWGAGAS